MNVWVGGLFQGRGLPRGIFFKLWHFPQRLTNRQHNFLNQLTLSNFSKSFLEIRYYCAVMLLSNKAPWGVVRWGGVTCKTDFIGGVYWRGLIQGRTLELASSLKGNNFPVYKFHVFEAEQKCHVCMQSNFSFTDLCFIY